jgi:hypothetical protein
MHCRRGSERWWEGSMLKRREGEREIMGKKEGARQAEKESPLTGVRK